MLETSCTLVAGAIVGLRHNLNSSLSRLQLESSANTDLWIGYMAYRYLDAVQGMYYS